MRWMPETPWTILTRHFLARLFDFELLADSLRGSVARPLTGVAGVSIALGLLLARVFSTRYRILHRRGDLSMFEQAVLTDHTFLLAVPMWILAFVAVLIGSALFPDETDFRVLMSLPLTRRLVFGAKLAAVALLAGLLFVIASVGLLPLFFLTLSSPWPDAPFIVQAAAYLASSALAAAFGGLGITAVHAVLLLVVPRSRLHSVSAATGSLLLVGLVMAVPAFIYLPEFKAAFEAGAWWLYWFPPAWFTGLEQWLIGDPRYGKLAVTALGALALVAAVAAGAYITLYRHFARVLTRQASDQGGRLDENSRAGRAARTPRRPAFVAVRAFTAATLRRSILHQGLFVTLSAFGAALVALAVLDVDFSPAGRRQELRLFDTLTWAPFALTFIVTVAIRASLLVPIEGRANWVFRMSERPELRPQAIDAAFSIARRLGVMLPCLVLWPLQWYALGLVSLLTTSIAMLAGVALVEVMLYDWRRIPFTCSLILGKGFVPQMVLVGFLSFVGYTTIGGALATISAKGPPIAGIISVSTLAVIIVVLWRHRLVESRGVSLEFEDSLPTEVSPLGLTGD